MFERGILGDEFDDQKRMIADTFEDYCSRNLEGYRSQWETDHEFPHKIMKDLSGIFGSSFTSEAPDERIDEVSLGAVSEIMGKYSFPVPAFLTLHFSKLIRHISDGSTRHHYGKMMENGSLVLCGAFSEPGCGSDSAAIRTSARQNGDGYTLNGEKAFVSSPGIADAFIVSARTSEAPEGRPYRGISLMIADSGIEGITPYEMENMASEFRGDFGGARFENAAVPDRNIIGKEGDGFRLLMNIFNTQRVHVALYSLGLAEKSLEEAAEYSKMRQTFGKPISRYQAISFRLAENWTRIEASRLLAYKALSLSGKEIDPTAYCAAVKWYACENAFRAVDESLQAMGASGYVKTSDMEKRFRAARGFLIGDGTPDIQKLIIARQLLGRDYAP